MFPLKASREGLVLHEGLAAPLLDDLLLEPRRPTVVLSAAAADWVHAAVPCGARAVALPGAISESRSWTEAIDEVLRVTTLSQAYALAEWGIPVPLRVLEPSDGNPAQQSRLEASGLFIVEDSSIGPVVVSTSDAALLMLGRRREWHERRADLLRAVTARLDVAESGVAVALLQGMACGCGWPLARRSRPAPHSPRGP